MKRDLRVRTLAPWGLQARAAGAARGPCVPWSSERARDSLWIRALAVPASPLIPLPGLPSGGALSAPTYSGPGCTTGSRH